MLSYEQDPQIRVLYDLCSMIVHTLQYPSSITLPFPATVSSEDSSSSSVIRRNRPSNSSSQISPAAFACLFLGVSLTLMICGSIIFLIGFILMPWIISLVIIVYFAGFLSNLLEFGRSFLIWALSPQDVHGWKQL